MWDVPLQKSFEWESAMMVSSGLIDNILSIFRQNQMGVSWNRGTPKSSMLVGFSLINHPAIGVPPFMETQMSYC